MARTNEDRIRDAALALHTYKDALGHEYDDEETEESSITDLMADLLHLADAEGLDHESIHRMSELHFRAEQTHRGEEI